MVPQFFIIAVNFIRHQLLMESISFYFPAILIKHRLFIHFLNTSSYSINISRNILNFASMANEKTLTILWQRSFYQWDYCVINQHLPLWKENYRLDNRGRCYLVKSQTFPQCFLRKEKKYTFFPPKWWNKTKKKHEVL